MLQFAYFKKENKADLLFKLSPVIILLWGFFSINFISIIPIASGFGWDGMEYAKVALNWPDIVGHLDRYRAGRILPSVIVYYSLVLFNFSISLENILSGFQFYNMIVLFFSAIVWVQIAKKIDLSVIAKWIGFVSLFINYPVLNLYFYYPALTDSTALLLGLLLLYSYFVKNRILLLIVSAISFFCWATIIVIGLLLFILSDNEKMSYHDCLENKKINIILFIIFMFPFVLLFAYYNLDGVLKRLIVDLRIDEILQLNFKNKYRYNQINLIKIVNSFLILLSISIFSWFLLKKINVKKMITVVFFNKKIVIKILLSFIIVGILSFLKSLLYSDEIPTITSQMYFFGVISGSIRFPLQFIICHIAYWGPAILLILINIKAYIEEIRKSDIAIIGGWLFTLFFIYNAESRAITNFYPFIVILTLSAIDFSKIKKPFLFFSCFSLVSLILSKIWLPIKIPSSVYPNAIWDNLDKFPMQWYFMNFGLWINKEMFILYSFCSAVLFVIFYIISKPYSSRKNV